MQRSSTTLIKKQLFSQVQSGDLVQGVNVVPTSVPSFTFSKSDKAVSQTTTTVFAKKIPLLDIRKKLLEKHERLGIVHAPTLLESQSRAGNDVVRSRYLKVWHDHSSVAGHGHFLVLVSIIYGTKILDVLRFFHGDGPAQQFEAGNSVGGAYFCVGCGVNWNRVDDIAYASRCELKSLQQRQCKTFCSKVWLGRTSQQGHLTNFC